MYWTYIVIDARVILVFVVETLRVDAGATTETNDERMEESKRDYHDVGGPRS